MDSGLCCSCCNEVCSSSGQRGIVHEIRMARHCSEKATAPHESSEALPAGCRRHSHIIPIPTVASARPVPHPFPDPFPLSLGCNALTLVLSPHGESSSIETSRASAQESVCFERIGPFFSAFAEVGGRLAWARLRLVVASSLWFMSKAAGPHTCLRTVLLWCSGRNLTSPDLCQASCVRVCLDDLSQLPSPGVSLVEKSETARGFTFWWQHATGFIP